MKTDDRTLNDLALGKYVKDLEESNRLKDLFSDIFRHDLTNPLTIISGYLDMTSEDELEGDIKETFQVIRRHTQKMISLIDEATTFTKLRRQTELEKKDIDLNQYITKVIWNFETFASEKQIKVEFENKEGLHINANEIIEEVFANLLSNAIKYSPEKTKVVIGVEKSGKDCRIYFKDQGEGIADEDKDAIFTRFERKQKGNVKGIGLGLAITKKIVELHKGRIWVEDNPQGGSIFIVELPIL